MRLATKNEVLILLGACVPAFAAHCVSPDGAITRFLFDNATSFDLDSDLVRGMVAQLNGAGIVDAECVARFAGFGVVADVPKPKTYRTYYAPAGEPLPEGAASVDDVTNPGVRIITVEVTA